MFGLWCFVDQTQKYLRTGASGTPTRLKSTGSRATTRVVDSSISVAAEDTERCLHIRLVLRTAELRVSGAEVLPERMEMSAESTAVLQTGDAGVAARSPAMKVQGEELEVSHAVLVTVAGAAQPHHKRHTVTEDEGSATLKGGAGITPMFAPHRLSASNACLHRAKPPGKHTLGQDAMTTMHALRMMHAALADALARGTHARLAARPVMVLVGATQTEVFV
eukprot:scpid3866/ scgid1491/ 